MRVNWDPFKNEYLKRTRGIGFDDALELFSRPYVVQAKTDDPEQYKAIGFARGGLLISLIIEIRTDDQGEFEWWITLWRASKEEAMIYDQSN